MSERENVHSGHRKRMINRFLENSDNLLDHELLEILLFSMLPRVNTNPIAHRLIKTFGSLRDVFTASVEELKVVDGIGQKTAEQIYFIGVFLKRIEEKKKQTIKLGCFELVKKEIEELFQNENKEKFFLLLLDKNYKKLAVIEFFNNDKERVSAEVPSVAKFFALYKPKNIIIAHNHPSGRVEPSRNDDLATMKINLLCSAHSVNLADHVIYSNGNFYSYMMDNKLDELKKKADLNEMLNNLQKL